MARIYTRTGDQGQTSLGDGSRTVKSDPRIDLYGDVDELNSLLGVCLGHLGPENGDGPVAVLQEACSAIQSQLFDLGAVLADRKRCREFAQGQEEGPAFPVRSLEVLIDGLTRDLPELRNFILPGGTPAAGFLHLARAVCRRAERKAVALAADEPVPATAVIYLNRLSDFLFTAARAANAAAGQEDVPWRPQRSEG